MFNEAMGVLAELPRSMLALHMFAKFLFGVGVGILLDHYVEFDGGLAGWIFVIIAVIVAIPSSVRVISGLRVDKR